MTWLKLGWADLLAERSISLFYGLCFAAASVVLVIGLYALDLHWVILPAAAGFLIVGPLMALTPILFLIAEQMEGTPKTDEDGGEMEFSEDEHPVIIAGFGRFGQITGRILRAKKIGFTALERDANQVDFVTGFGAKVYYGDASRIDLLHKAGASKAKIFVIAVNDTDQSVQIAATVRQSFPRLKIIARARDRNHALRLMSFGVTHVVREMFHSSLEVSRNVLEGLGMAPHDANYVVETFRDHDEQRLIDQRQLRGDQAAMKASAKKWADELEAIFAADVAAEEAADETRTK